jgi:hypothetical protein
MKRTIRRLMLIVICYCFVVLCYAQSNPEWLRVLPPRTETYYYRVSQAIAKTEEAALKKAFAMAIYESAFALGISVDLQKLEQMSDDSSSLSLSRYVNIPINVVCRYVEETFSPKAYRAYLLCQVANKAGTIPKYKTFNCFFNREEDINHREHREE